MRENTMRKKLIITFLFISSTFAKSAIVELVIEGLKSNKGVVRASIFEAQNSDYFPSGKDKALAKIKSGISNKQSKLQFLELKPGNYAVAVYHDKNNNGKIDRSIFGKPKEAYGFSNNPKRPRRGPVAFSKAQFIIKNLNKKERIIIKVRK